MENDCNDRHKHMVLIRHFTKAHMSYFLSFANLIQYIKKRKQRTEWLYFLLTAVKTKTFRLITKQSHHGHTVNLWLFSLLTQFSSIYFFNTSINFVQKPRSCWYFTAESSDTVFYSVCTINATTGPTLDHWLCVCERELMFLEQEEVMGTQTVLNEAEPYFGVQI